MTTRQQYGFSLVEILVAMIISLFLLGGVIQVYTGNKATYGFSESLARVQENGRFAMDSITRDLRMSGFWGSTVFEPSTPFINNSLNTNFSATFSSELHGFLIQPAIEGTEDLGANKSDTLTVRGTTPSMSGIAAPYPQKDSTDDIILSGTNFFKIGDIALLSNFKGATIFEVSTIDEKKISTSGVTFPRTYDQTSSIHKLQTVTYSINATQKGTSLFRQVFNQPQQELVEGIEQMQILYGINTDSNNTTPNKYVISTNVTDWNNVITVRIMLLAVSPNTAPGVPTTYRYNGQNLTSSDNRLRQEFTVTIALRNKV